MPFAAFIPSVSHTDAYGRGVGHEGGSYEFFEVFNSLPLHCTFINFLSRHTSLSPQETESTS